MRTKEINGVMCVDEKEYLDAPFGTDINHVLMDLRDQKIITEEKMNVFEKEKRNAAARKVGEKYLVWVPALFK